MKRTRTHLYLLLLLTSVFYTLPFYSQSSQYALYNYRNDGDFNAWLNLDIDSITYSCIDTLGVEHEDIVVQEVWTPDSLYRIPMEAIDSIGFRAPAPEMREGLFYLRDYHAEHTLIVDSLTLYFDTSIHQDSLPSVGQTIICATQTTPYEESFAGKVVDINYEDGQIAIQCEEAAVGDIFKRLVLVGKASTEVGEVEGSKSRTRNWWTDPWVNIQDDGIVPIQLEEKSFEILDGMVKVTSPSPKLTCRYYVYVSEVYYEIFAQVDIVHKDLTYTLDVSTKNLNSLADYGKFFMALTSEEKMDKWLEKKFKKPFEEFEKEEKEQEEIEAEKEILTKIWKTKKVDIPLLGNGVVNLSLMLAPLFKMKGSIEAISEFKTDAIQSLSLKIKGYTPLPRSGYISDFSALHRQDPIKSAKLDMKITGGVTLGFTALLNVNLIHRNVLYAGVGGEMGMDLAAILNVTLIDDQQPEMNMYDRLKDTRLKLCYYAKVYPEIGVTPLDILHLSGKNWDLTTWEIFTTESTLYMMPHFTEPTLPKFVNKAWTNDNPLGFYSTASKDIFLPCKVGMRITDTEGNVVKEYLENKRYLEEYEWLDNPLSINVSDLPKGVSYKCYPTISFFGLDAFNAGPVHNFSAPLSMVASPTELTLKVGSTGTVEYLGGWDTFAVVIVGDEDVVSFVNDKESTAREIQVLAEKVGTTTLQIEDRRTGEKLNVPITVTDEDIPSLQLSSTSLVLQEGKQGTVEVSSGSGNYTAESSDADVATVTISDGSVQITAVAAGTATITVTDTETNLTANIEVEVTEEEETPYIPVQTETFTVNGVSFKMVKVEGGTFMMGAADDDSDAASNEKPLHEVTLSNFSIGETEVTQELWEAVMGSNPSNFEGAQRPVEQVSWDDCRDFISKLNALTGKQFRLPTEAEWEYAARGGNKSQGYKYSGSNTIDDVAWYCDNSEKSTHDVKTKQANELGLYDMSGNVWEWCQDWYDESYYSSSSQSDPTGPSTGSSRVNRGGSWYFGAGSCRVSFRDSSTPDNWYRYFGLRLAISDEVIAKENDSDDIETFTVNGVSFKMVKVEGGTFMMGAADDDSDADNDEKPQHQVTLSSFSIGETEVTQELWEAVMGSNPSNFEGAQRPVEGVSWDDCQDFISKLNALTGKQFRLPTEAEWEYAARGGNKSQGYKYSGSNTIEDVAWYWDNSEESTHDVKTKQANELGLYDMSGNVLEWCEDLYDENYYSSSSQSDPTGPSTEPFRVNRGGCWGNYARFCRVSYRDRSLPDYGDGDHGLRLAISDEVVVKENNSGDIETFTVNGVSFNMAPVEGGTFMMGAADDDSDADSNEKPQHQVTLSSFSIGETEVTQELWEAVMGSNPSNFESAQRPVEQVSWDDCQDFISKLNALTGKQFRLPTEAEWEYAARGGNMSKGYKYSGSNTIDDVAWYWDNSEESPHDVKTKQANELGLYDMSGNVWEWCQDWYDESYYSSSSQSDPTGPSTGSLRVSRGGSWGSSAWFCRVSYRNNLTPDYRNYNYGLRLAL